MNVEKKYLKRGLEHISPLFRQQQQSFSVNPISPINRPQHFCVGGLQLGKASKLCWLTKMQQCLARLNREFVCFQAKPHKKSIPGKDLSYGLSEEIDLIPVASGQAKGFPEALKSRIFLIDFSICKARELDNMILFLDHLVLYVSADLDGQIEAFRFLKWISQKKSSLVPVHLSFINKSHDDRNEFYFEQFSKLVAEKTGVFIEYAGTLKADEISLEEFLMWQKFFNQKATAESSPFRSRISEWADAHLFKGNSNEPAISDLLR